jgi:hypothetical protein
MSITHSPRRIGRPPAAKKKECPVHTVLDQPTKAKFDAVIARRQESQGSFVRRAVLDLLEREYQAA